MPHEVARWRFAAVGVLLGMIVLFGVLLRRAPGIVAATVYPSTLVGRVRTYLDKFMVSVRSILTLQRICLAMLLSLVNWAAQIATYHLVAVAAHFPISIVGSVTTLITANVGFVVRATPGNVGVFQVVYGVTARGTRPRQGASGGGGAAAPAHSESAGDAARDRDRAGPAAALAGQAVERRRRTERSNRRASDSAA